MAEVNDIKPSDNSCPYQARINVRHEILKEHGKALEDFHRLAGTLKTIADNLPPHNQE